MPTLVGIFFLLAGLYCLLLQESAFLGLLILASVFQASSAIKFGDRGIPAFYVVEVLLCARAAAKLVQGARLYGPMRHGKWLLAFWFVAVLSAFVYPRLFAGIPIYDPLSGIDADLLYQPPLAFSMSNTTQAVYITLHLATAYSCLLLRFSPSNVRKYYLAAFYVVLAYMAMQSVCQALSIPFPDTILRNNPNVWDPAQYAAGTRKPGTFLEPSFAGAFFVFYAIGFLSEYLDGRLRFRKAALALLACGMVTSSGSLLALTLSILALVYRTFPLSRSWHLNTRKAKRLALLTLAIAAPPVMIMLLSPAYRATLLESTVSKGGTGSFFNRTASDLFAVDLVFQTHGLGVGLGSSRASSMITSLASNVGLAGLLAFVTFYWRLFTGLNKEYSWLKWSAFALLTNMCVDVPDVTFPVLWIPILIAVSVREREPSMEQTERLQTPGVLFREVLLEDPLH